MPLKLNLGCGGNILPDFENRDADCDITKPLPWPDNSVDYILIEHCLEHVTGPEGFSFMKEARRILKDGGTLRICVPQLKNVDAYKKIDLIINHGHVMVYCYENLVLMLEAAGFKGMHTTERKDCDGHWRVIGEALDTAETLRIEATK